MQSSQDKPFSFIREADTLTPHSTLNTLHFTLLVKGVIFAQKLTHGKNHNPRKSGKLPEPCRFFLCEPKLNIHNSLCLWKTLVEKLVENVENSEFSTGILSLWISTAPCGNHAYPFA